MSAVVSAEPKVVLRCSSRCCLAYGNKVSLTKEMGAIVPSMSSTKATGAASCVSFAFLAGGPAMQSRQALDTSRVGWHRRLYRTSQRLLLKGQEGSSNLAIQRA